jgi:hypothetical protein
MEAVISTGQGKSRSHRKLLRDQSGIKENANHISRTLMSHQKNIIHQMYDHNHQQDYDNHHVGINLSWRNRNFSG